MRSEDIELAAQYYEDSTHGKTSRDGFIDGAKWADRNPVLTKQVEDDGLCVVIHCEDEQQAKVVASLVEHNLTVWRI